MLSQQIINALSQGAFYALFAAGLTLIFGVLDILNMAHGAVFMWGAMLSWYLMTALEVNFGFSLLITIVFCGLMGLLLEHTAFRPLRGRSSGHLPPLVSSLALSIVLVHVAEKIFGTRVVRYPDDAVPFAQSVAIGSVQVSLLHVVLLVVALVLMGALWYR